MTPVVTHHLTEAARSGVREMTVDESNTSMKRCPYCQEKIRAVAIKCRYCEQYLDGRPQDSDSTVSTIDRMLLPVGRPVSAIAAGYLALFGILPLVGFPFALGALVCGLFARKAIKTNSDLSGTGRAWFGIILGGLMTLIDLVVLAILGISTLSQSM